jgi:hypothetical protein
MRRAHQLGLRDALALEDLRGKRDARYRANLAFAGRAIRSILLTVAVGSSLAWGWPVPARLIVSRVTTEVSTDATHPPRTGLVSSVQPSSGALPDTVVRVLRLWQYSQSDRPPREASTSDA